jgi:hypothetical protein
MQSKCTAGAECVNGKCVGVPRNLPRPHLHGGSGAVPARDGRGLLLRYIRLDGSTVLAGQQQLQLPGVHEAAHVGRPL